MEFPEVMRRGGFDAVVGNPPFIGGQRLTGTLGTDMREYLVQHVGGGQRGSADLCAYFYLRDLAVTNGGRVGIIATNTISQGDTREVGLAQALNRGWQIYRAEKSRPWEGTASLEVSLIWSCRSGDHERFVLDDREVPGITSTLDSQSRIAGDPHRLAANADKSFIGSYVLGMGFVLTPEQAHKLIEKDPRNRDVLFPYLNGDDLNSHWDLSASRWVINFHDWDEDKARTYPDCYEIVEQKVKPFRAQNNRKVYREYWWQYAEKRPALHRAIRNLQRVLVFARVSKIGLPQFVATGQVMSEQLVVIATDALEDLALLSSDIHYFWWTVKGNSTLETRLRYTPSDGFETFPRCLLTDRVRSAGEALHAVRREVMELRKWGLTQLYNCIYDPSVAGEEISSLRDIHVEINEAVCEAYALQEEQDPGIRKFEARVASKPLPAWRDIELRHGFYETQQGIRFAISPQARDDVLDKLLALNHYRYQQEVSQGLHSGKGGRKGAKAAERQPKETEVGPGRGTDAVDSADGALDGLFAPPGALF
ncbi:conserved hypothetical protein [Thermomonospora curvata DSM 43183]|uniref:site-specific DNA-methyltransferase (adenine-specific) n=1 Tax=Thermomonospora curvata (strain ATCC 19995 / DSM 43183 / JCM 3096 / KCTC 9072 / NBRC 15933 / NCIMB 10081 / Henssen B9) TaxID=471852 RepID=D1A2J4_THECD|nr:conserved hypothetical protein [Thermomonospora curvata DSM 43183]